MKSCADFIGSRTGPNQVSSRMSPFYQGSSFMKSREPGQLYVVGGDSPPPNLPIPPGPFVAKVNPTSGAQIWPGL
jgi:hypothetical protein